MGLPPNIRDQSYFEVQWRINRLILNALEKGEVYKEIVDAMFEELNAEQLGYLVIGLWMPDEQGEINLVAASHTQAEKIIEGEIKIRGILHEAYLSKKEVFRPVTEPMKCTVLAFPVLAKGQALGVLTFHIQKDSESLGEHEKVLLQGIVDAAGVALENSKLYEKLKELDKLKDEFLSLATHELRTPMTAIKGYSYELMKNRAGDKTNQYAERIYKSTERLVNLVNDMLDVSRIESGRIELKPESVDLNKLISEVVEELQIKASEKSQRLETKVESSSPVVVNIDSAKFTQILMNIIGNALKFTPDGGKIEVKLSQSGQDIRISVSDTGVGMDADDISKLFGKFERVKSGNGIPGTGLGLYLSKKLIEMMGGKIAVESGGIGKGSTFTLTLLV